MGVDQHMKHIIIMSIILISQEANKTKSRHRHGFFHSITIMTVAIMLWACKSSSSMSTQGTVLLLAEFGAELADLLGL